MRVCHSQRFLKGRLVLGDVDTGLEQAVKDLLNEGHTRIILNLAGLEYGLGWRPREGRINGVQTIVVPPHPYQ